MGTTRQIVTLANLVKETLSRLDGTDHKDSQFYSAEVLTRDFSEAYRIIQRQTHLWGAEYKQDLRVASGADKGVAYNCPPDLLDNLILGGKDWHSAEGGGVMAMDADGKPSWLRGVTWEQMRSMSGDFSNPDNAAGPPRYWAFSRINFDVDGADIRQIVIWPPPETAVSDGLVIDYIPDPGFSGIRGIIDPAVELRGQTTESASLTAAVTNGSPTVTLSALPTQLFVPNQAFGVRSSSDQLPRYWYRIVETEVENATLDPEQFNVRPDYEQADNAAAIPVISDVSGIEWKAGGTIGYAPVEYALEQAAMRLARVEGAVEAADRIRAGSFWAEALAQIVSASRQMPGIGPTPVSAGRHNPGIRFRGRY